MKKHMLSDIVRKKDTSKPLNNDEMGSVKEIIIKKNL